MNNYIDLMTAISPYTGDTTSYGWLIPAGIVVAAALVAFIILGKKRK